MMGLSHAGTGAAGAIWITGLMHVPLPGTMIVVACATGAALWPDIDHPRSTVSNVYGPFSRFIPWLLRAIGFRHRTATHSLVGIGTLAGLAYLGVHVRLYLAHGLGPRIPILVTFVCLCVPVILSLAAVVRLAHIPGWLDDLAPIPLVLGTVYLTRWDLSAVPLALALGAVIHVVGDMLTPEGCPIFWPLSMNTYSLGLFRTGKLTESCIVFPLVIVAFIAGIVWRLHTGV